MGLDITLYRESKYAYGLTNVMFWRNANYINEWFEKKLGKTREEHLYVLKEEHIRSLISDHREVLRNHDLAKSIFPTAKIIGGGSTLYDDAYFDTLEDTLKQLRKLIRGRNKINWETEYLFYHKKCYQQSTGISGAFYI